jgi:hypothetical protein
VPAVAQVKHKKQIIIPCSQIKIPYYMGIDYDKRNKCYMVFDWYGEKRYLTRNLNFYYPSVEAPARFKSICEAKEFYYYRYLHGHQDSDIITIIGDTTLN